MKIFFSLTIALIVIIQVLFFLWSYFFGGSGYQKIESLREENQSLSISVAALEKRVHDLEKELDNFKKYPYYKEKIIREELQMLKPNETIVIIP